MREAWTIVAIPVSVFVFYVLIPTIGAFYVRRRWRDFRSAIIRSIMLPRLDHAMVRELPANDETSDLREFWFLGRLESIGRSDIVWLEHDGLSVGLDISRMMIVLLPTPAQVGGELPDETPRTVSWKEITALVEGTRFFVSGGVDVVDGMAQFVWTDEHRPLVIVYDGPDDTLVARSLWTGRQRNEYWNHLTPASLVGGFLALLFLGVVVLDTNRLMSLVSAVLATVPVLPLLPPGVVGFYLYRRIWRRARRFRARRDLISLPEQLTGDASETAYEHRLETTVDRVVTIPSPANAANHTYNSDMKIWAPVGPAREILPCIRRPSSAPRDVSRMSSRAYTLEFGALAFFFSGILVNAYIAAIVIVLALR